MLISKGYLFIIH